MHVSPPLPEKPRTIYPSWPRRVAFRLLGWTAVLVRGCMWIPRSIASIREPRRPLLIVEPYGMGDALLLQPLIRAWLDTGRTVTLAARPAWKPLFPAHPHFRFLPFEPAWARTDAARKYRHPLRDVRDAVSVLYSAARGADVIEPRGDVRALLVLHLAGAARVFTLERYFSANDCRVPFLAGIRAPVRRDVTRRVLSAAWLPPGAPDERVSLAHLRPAAAKAPRKPSRRIGLIPSTTWRGKRWPDEHWRALVPRLRERGWDPVWLCGPGETASLPNAAPQNPVARVSQTVSQWVAELDACAAVIAVNTGPMHLADALDKPLIVLDGPSRLPLWAPENPNAIVLHRQNLVPWAPVTPHGNGIRSQKKLMALITPDDVLQALDSLLPR